MGPEVLGCGFYVGVEVFVGVSCAPEFVDGFGENTAGYEAFGCIFVG